MIKSTAVTVKIMNLLTLLCFFSGRYCQLAVRLLSISFLLCLFSQSTHAQKPSALKFRAATVKIDITPEDSQNLLGYGARMSDGVLDHIYHRIIVLDDGITQFFLVSSDIGAFSPAEYDKVAAKLKSLYGINPVNFWWTVTHTHSAPEVGPPGLGTVFLGDRFLHQIDANYTALVERKLIEGIQEAKQKLVPARLGVGWGFSQANINRRAVDVDGKASLGLNPDDLFFVHAGRQERLTGVAQSWNVIPGVLSPQPARLGLG